MSTQNQIHEHDEPTLRCKNCGKPIMVKEAVRTPTGYSCKECVRGQQKVFTTAKWYDYILAVVVAGVLSFLTSMLFGFVSGFLGFFMIFLVITIGPATGGIIAEVVRAVVGKRRGKTLFLVTAAAVAIGGALPHIWKLLFVLSGNFYLLFDLIFPAIFVVLATGAVYYRLSGIRLGR